MLSALAAMAPIFCLILAGFAARRARLLGSASTSELSRFVVTLALPTLMFDVVAHTGWDELWQPGFVAAFGVAMFLVFAATALVSRRMSRAMGDAPIDGLNAAYANTGFLGFPLALAAFGEAAMAETMIATVLTVCVLFAVAIVMIEIAVEPGRDRRALFAGVSRSLVVNPLLVAPVLGLLVMLGGVDVPGPVDRFIDLLGAAAAPCALIAIGSFLGEERPRATRVEARVVVLTATKLFVQPALTWALAALVFRLPPDTTRYAVLLAALPTGTGSFLLADFYHRELVTTSRVILASTLCSIVTIPAYLAYTVP